MQPGRPLRFLVRALVLLGATALACEAATVADEIKPPFGLHWGESATRIEKLLTGAKARVVDRKELGGRDAWTVEGLVQNGLRRTVFYFKKRQLVEVELQYQSDEWDTTKYDEFMGSVRRRIEQKYGAGQMVDRQKRPAGSVMQTLVRHVWNVNDTAIELIYFAAEDSTQIYRTVSVHYKGS